MIKTIFIILSFIVLLPTTSWSAETVMNQADTESVTEIQNDEGTDEQRDRIFRHVNRDDIGLGEKFITIGIVYSVQWAYYLIFQLETIQEEGSFRNWYSNIYQPHFDKDSYNYNLIWHTGAGTCYYLFFRSRGYSKSGALAWGFVSQLLFEFTVETITEKPSFQDIFQTPVLGAIVGMTLEFLSKSLLSTDYTIAHILGYILNPFALLPCSSYEIIASPQITTTRAGYAFALRF